jgi:hypothetical protein
MTFSERIGKKEPKSILQRDSMDQDLRVGLWNVFDIFVGQRLASDFLSRSGCETLIQSMWFQHFKWPLDSISSWGPDVREKLREQFFRGQWNEVYDFLEFVGKNGQRLFPESEYQESCNSILERELSAYRFVGAILVPISSETEIDAIKAASENADSAGLKGISGHLRSAAEMLSDRKTPDYRNSIKESISAVESAAQLLTGNPSATLGQALKVIGDKVPIHGALKKGFDAIYGYTSDEGGIRHAMLDDPKCDFEDAKYMLVACSAFVSYLLGKAAKVGVALK